MPTRSVPAHAGLRPCSSRELERRLDEAAASIARLARGSGAGLRPLVPAELLRCLAPLTSRN